MSDDYYYISGGITDPWNYFNELKEGDICKTGNVNPYFNYFLKQLPGGVTLGTQRVSSLAFLNGVRGGTTQTLLSVPQIADVGQRIAMHFCKYTRELIWENIRLSEFSHLPSRQRCIWLSHGLKNLSYWEGALGREPGNYKVFRVELDGVTHEASDDFLMRDEIVYTDAILMARDYWNGKITNQNKKETLFEGTFTVKEQIK